MSTGTNFTILIDCEHDLIFSQKKGIFFSRKILFHGNHFGNGSSETSLATSFDHGEKLSEQITDAIVKWFRADKGFGFVELENSQHDAFIHIAKLQEVGYDAIFPGSKLKVLVGQGPRGAQVTKVLEVDTNTATENLKKTYDAANAIEMSGKVKNFDRQKGYGFIATNDGGKDVFIHISVLETARIAQLQEGQNITMHVVTTPKGREAISVTISQNQ